MYTMEGCLDECYNNRLKSRCGCTMTIGTFPTGISCGRSSMVIMHHTDGFHLWQKHFFLSESSYFRLRNVLKDERNMRS